MTVPCEHRNLVQTSTAVVETEWIRSRDRYVPVPLGEPCISRVVEEDTGEFRCADCGHRGVLHTDEEYDVFDAGEEA